MRRDFKNTKRATAYFSAALILLLGMAIAQSAPTTVTVGGSTSTTFGNYLLSLQTIDGITNQIWLDIRNLNGQYLHYVSSPAGVIASPAIIFLGETKTVNLIDGTSLTIKVAAIKLFPGLSMVSEATLEVSVPGQVSAPSAPQNLAVQAGNGQVTLTWQAPADNGGAAIINYNVYRGTASANKLLIATIGNILTFADIGVTNNQQVFYEITAVNSVGESARSNEIAATPAPATTKTELTVPPGSLVILPGNDKLQLTSGIVGGVQVLVTDSNSNQLANQFINQGQTIDLLSRGYTITAKSFFSTVTFEIATLPTLPVPVLIRLPSAPQNLAVQAGNGQVTLTWQAPANNGGATVTNYKIYRGTTSTNKALVTTVGNVLTFQDTGLANGQKVFYKVTAVNLAGEGSIFNSIEVSATPTGGAQANTPPSATITTPAGTQRGNITISYNLIDPESNTASVNVQLSADNGATFSAATRGTGGDGVTGLTTSPTGIAHTFVWNSVADGVAASAVNNQVRIRITPSDTTAGTAVATNSFAVDNRNQPPTASITNPAAGATFTAPATFTIEATATDPDGTVAKVEFFQGATKLGEDTTAPFSQAVNNLAAGTYSLTTVATDNLGASTTSAAIGIAVTASGGGGGGGPSVKSSFNPANRSTVQTSFFTLTFNTSVTDTCRWSFSDTDFNSMANSFQGAGTTVHSAQIGLLTTPFGFKNVSLACTGENSTANTDLVYNLVNILDFTTLIGTNSIASSVMTNSTVNSSTLNSVTGRLSSIRNSVLNGCNIVNSNISDTTATSPCSFVNTVVDPSNITGSSISGGSVINSNVTFSTSTSSNVTASSVTNSTLASSSVTSSTITNSTLTNSSLNNSFLIAGILINGTVAASTLNLCSLADSNAIGSTLTNCTITNSSLNLANILTNVTITRSTVINSTLVNTVVNSANITNNIIFNGTLALSNGTIYNASASGQGNLASLVNFPPVARFTVSTNSATIGQEITFTSAATDPNIPGVLGDRISHLWNFGDGTTSTAANPVKTYTSTGTFVVTYTAIDIFGLSNSTTATITITVASAAGGGSSSGGGGGSGDGGGVGGVSYVISASELNVIASQLLTYPRDFLPYTPIELIISQEISEKAGISKIILETDEVVSSVAAYVEMRALKGMPIADDYGQGLKPLPGAGQKALKVFQLIASENLRGKISQANFTITMRKDEMLNSPPSEIIFLRFSNKTWNQLPDPKWALKTGGSAEFVVTTPGFSVFVATTKPKPAEEATPPTASPQPPTPAPTANQTTQPTTPATGLITAYSSQIGIMLGIIIIIIIIFFYSRRPKVDVKAEKEAPVSTELADLKDYITVKAPLDKKEPKEPAKKIKAKGRGKGR